MRLFFKPRYSSDSVCFWYNVPNVLFSPNRDTQRNSFLGPQSHSPNLVLRRKPRSVVRDFPPTERGTLIRFSQVCVQGERELELDQNSVFGRLFRCDKADHQAFVE